MLYGCLKQVRFTESESQC